MGKVKTKAPSILLKAEGYEEWIRLIKERIQRARVKASMLVNTEQTLLYWDIGHNILEKQNNEGWGTKVVERMSVDLKDAFPDMTGWSPRNLKYMRAFADAWARKEIVQAPLAQLPWYHHLVFEEDSRMIIDENGTDRQNGKGDFLFRDSTGLHRGQVPYISDEDFESLSAR